MHLHVSKGTFSPVATDFVSIEVLQPSQPVRVMLSAISLPNHIFTGQA